MGGSVGKQKFNELLKAEKSFKSTIDELDYGQLRKIPAIIERQLTSGTATTTVKTGKVQLNEKGFISIVNSGNGSTVVKMLARTHVLHSTHQMYHIGVLVNLAFFSIQQYHHEEYHNYLMALRQAALSLFLTKVITPEHLEMFIIISQAMKVPIRWKDCFGEAVASWYASQSAERLRRMVFLWPLNGRWSHHEILKRCGLHLESMKVKKDVMEVIETLASADFDTQQFAPKGGVCDHVDIDVIIPKLRNRQIAAFLTTVDIDRIMMHMDKESYSEKASALETLLVRKKFEASGIEENDVVGECLRDVHRIVRKTETYSGPRIGVIPFVFEEESGSLNPILLQHKDLSAALLEDLMRNDQSKMLVRRTLDENGNKKFSRFYYRREMPEKSEMIDIQNGVRYDPVKVIRLAQRGQEVFDCFVVVGITGEKIKFDEIYEALKDYRSALRLPTKLVIIGVDDLCMTNPCDITDNVLFVSGVNEGTPALLWDYMPPQLT